MDREGTIYSLGILMNMVTRSRRVYEVLIANGADVHQFYNKYQTTIAAIQLVRQKLDADYNFSDECVEIALQQARRLVNEFVTYVGERIRYYDVEEMVPYEDRG